MVEHQAVGEGTETGLTDSTVLFHVQVATMKLLVHTIPAAPQAIDWHQVILQRATCSTSLKIMLTQT